MQKKKQVCTVNIGWGGVGVINIILVGLCLAGPNIVSHTLGHLLNLGTRVKTEKMSEGGLGGQLYHWGVCLCFSCPLGVSKGLRMSCLGMELHIVETCVLHRLYLFFLLQSQGKYQLTDGG